MASSFEPLLHPRADGAPDWLTALAAQPGRGGFTARHTYEEVLPATMPPAEDPAIAAAYAQGEAAGRAAALAEAALDDAARKALAIELAGLDGELRDVLAGRLAEAVAALCEATLAPLALDREALQRRCVDAACAVGDGIIDASLRLHPADIDLLDPAFAATWHIVADGALERGTVVFDMPEGAVRDGPEEWRIALREALGLC
ncbi:MAG: flagellar biosynthesis protein [Erythrobacter sp.]|nr:MAG: flagellar biosynthesis protein [Erythrobacter sp.]